MTLLHCEKLQGDYKEQLQELGCLGKIWRLLVTLRGEKKEAQKIYGPSLQFSTLCTSCGFHFLLKKH